ncbi:hypothetical protein OIV83_004645 [Microbotryomycetes sp. JL201]|nr:hypothetical protein OIV83_004645 [Microbotryomycetes sp. JL201]
MSGIGALPTVAPGANPWTAYIGAFESAVTKPAPPGFRGRLIALIALTAFTALLGLVYLAILLRDALDRDKETDKRKGIWLFRNVQRANGRFIITNTRLAMTLCTLLNCAVQFGYLQDIWSVSILGQSQAQSTSWRSLSFIPLFVHGWVVCWASLQSFLLTTDHHHKQLLSPKLANLLFVGLGAVLFFASLGVAIANIATNNKLFDTYTALLRQLRTNEAAWRPSDNYLVQLVNLSPQIQKLLQNARSVRKYNLIQLSVMILVPLIVMNICANSLRLALVIRTQIIFNINQCRKHADASRTINTVQGLPPPPVEDEKSSRFRGPRQSVVSIMSINKQHLSRAELRQLAHRRGSGPEDRERLRHIQALQKAENDLITINLILFVAISAITAMCGYALAALAKYSTLTAIPWSGYETLLVGVQWCFVLAVSAVLIGLLFSTWSSRSLSDQDGSNFWSSTFSNPLTSHQKETNALGSFVQGPRTATNEGEWRDQSNPFFHVDGRVERLLEEDENDGSSDGAVSPLHEKKIQESA